TCLLKTMIDKLLLTIIDKLLPAWRAQARIQKPISQGDLCVNQLQLLANWKAVFISITPFCTSHYIIILFPLQSLSAGITSVVTVLDICVSLAHRTGTNWIVTTDADLRLVTALDSLILACPLSLGAR